jgi:hypothetical protein
MLFTVATVGFKTAIATGTTQTRRRIRSIDMNVSEDQLGRWAKPPSETEEGKCQHTVQRITKALRAKFGNAVSIFLQGSYKNRTNVRLDSDVDVVVRHDGHYFPDAAFLNETDKALYWKHFSPSQYSFSQFKADVFAALTVEFDYGEVVRQNKCITVKKNSQRVNADVVPCFEHRRLKNAYEVYAKGIEFITDSGEHIISFPEQHYGNGVAKNDNTSRLYKSEVRILKNVRNELIDQRQLADNEMPSFFLECLVYNVENHNFDSASYTGATRSVIATVWNDMGDHAKANEYTEVSELLWLFKGNPKRTPKQARDFMQLAWDFLGYK